MAIPTNVSQRMSIAAASALSHGFINRRQFDELTDGRVSRFDRQLAKDIFKTQTNERAEATPLAIARQLVEAVDAHAAEQTFGETNQETLRDLQTSAARLGTFLVRFAKAFTK